MDGSFTAYFVGQVRVVTRRAGTEADGECSEEGVERVGEERSVVCALQARGSSEQGAQHFTRSLVVLAQPRDNKHVFQFKEGGDFKHQVRVKALLRGQKENENEPEGRKRTINIKAYVTFFTCNLSTFP